jgi:hypothetical protein
VLNDSVMKNAAELSRTVSARNLNPNLGRTTSRTAIEPVADAAASPGFFKRNKKTLQSVGGGLALGGLGIGGYALGQDIAKGQAGGESKVTDAYNDTAEWATGAYSDAAGWTTGAYGDTVEWGDGAVETVNGWF